MTKTKTGEIIFCQTCKTDLRIQNEKYHEDLGHDVQRLNQDPRDNRVKLPPAEPGKKTIVFGSK